MKGDSFVQDLEKLFFKNLKSEKEIFQLLLYFNDSFNPSLTERGIDLEAYSKKLSVSSICIGAYYSNECVGFTSFYANDFENLVSYLTLILVDDKYSGKKIGQLLLDKFFEVPIDRKMKKAKLKVYEDNLTAINFYKKNGFEFSEKSLNDFLYMIKNL